MASIKNFKKEVTYTLGALLDECMILMVVGSSQHESELVTIAEEVAAYYDELIPAIGKRTDNRAAYLKDLRATYNTKVEAFISRFEALN